jgi:hypothetical protein
MADPAAAAPIKECGNAKFGIRVASCREARSTVGFAREMTCRAARRNIARVRYPRTPPYGPTRRGCRCLELESALEYSDVRCSRRGSPSVAFRYRTGS